MTQNEVLLEYLRDNPQGITPLEALEKFGIYRLSARINDLRKQYIITTDNISRNGKTFARYRLDQSNTNEVGQILVF